MTGGTRVRWDSRHRDFSTSFSAKGRGQVRSAPRIVGSTRHPSVTHLSPRHPKNQVQSVTGHDRDLGWGNGDDLLFPISFSPASPPETRAVSDSMSPTDNPGPRGVRPDPRTTLGSVGIRDICTWSPLGVSIQTKPPSRALLVPGSSPRLASTTGTRRETRSLKGPTHRTHQHDSGPCPSVPPGTR